MTTADKQLIKKIIRRLVTEIDGVHIDSFHHGFAKLHDPGCFLKISIPNSGVQSFGCVSYQNSNVIWDYNGKSYRFDLSDPSLFEKFKSTILEQYKQELIKLVVGLRNQIQYNQNTINTHKKAQREHEMNLKNLMRSPLVRDLPSSAFVFPQAIPVSTLRR